MYRNGKCKFKFHQLPNHLNLAEPVNWIRWFLSDTRLSVNVLNGFSKNLSLSVFDLIIRLQIVTFQREDIYILLHGFGLEKFSRKSYPATLLLPNIPREVTSDWWIWYRWHLGVRRYSFTARNWNDGRRHKYVAHLEISQMSWFLIAHRWVPIRYETNW